VTPQTVLGYVGPTGNAAALNPLPLLTDRPEETASARKPNLALSKKKH
jgi:hypothetical protein